MAATATAQVFPSEVDIIVVGGGAAGLIVASRLAAASPHLEICVVESGRNNRDEPTVVQPAMYLSHLAPGSTTATFHQAKPSAHLNGRAPIVPTGAILGGGSSINFMMRNNAAASDYDAWNMPGWSFQEMLPLLKKSHTLNGATNLKVHGTTGPIKVSKGGHQSKLGDEFLDVVAAQGVIPFAEDVQDYQTIGASRWDKYISAETGRRSDTAHCYLHPLLDSGVKNLHLIVEHKTVRVLFEGTVASGVEYVFNPEARTASVVPPAVGELKTMKARKMVVLSSGALSTPLILERSGVGASEILEPLGIPIVKENKGVGKEYQDHQLFMAVYHGSDDADTLDEYFRGNPEVHAVEGARWAKDGSGKVATNVIDAGYKVRPNAEDIATMDAPMKQYWDEEFANVPNKALAFGGVLAGLLGDHSAVPGGNYYMCGAFLNYPASRGSVHITSATSPFVTPDFDAGYLENPADIWPNRFMYKTLRETARRMPSFRGEFAAIHPAFAETSAAKCVPWVASTEPIVDLVYTAEDDAAVDCWIRDNIGTTWHSCATAPMKPESEGGVVDARLNVFGVEKLKIIDLSIMPKNVGCNTYSAAIAIGEKGASIIAEDLGFSLE